MLRNFEATLKIEILGYFKNRNKFSSEKQFVLLAPDLKIGDFVKRTEESLLSGIVLMF